MNGFKVSKDLTLPLEAARWTNAALAIKGAGKTYGSADFAEELVAHNVPIIVIEPLGIWWGLKVGVNEKGEPDQNVQGLPIVVFGGGHQDLPLPLLSEVRGKQSWQKVDENKLSLMVKSILESGINAILDTSGLSIALQRRIVGLFVFELMRLYEKDAATFGPRHVFLEEVDRFCPQRVTGDLTLPTGAIEQLVSMGGNYNLGCTLISQRPAKVNKNILTQCNCLMLWRILHKLDKDAVKSWVESIADPKDPKVLKWYDTLRELKNGEAWIWHPDADTPKYNIWKRIKFRKRRTLHATREYFTLITKKPLKPTDVTEYVQKYLKVFEPPKPKPEPKPTESRLVPEKATYDAKHKILDIPMEPPVTVKAGETKCIPFPTPNDVDAAMETVRINQTLPNIQIQQFKPTIALSVEQLSEPTSPLGRVCVVLKNDAQAGGRQDAWTTKRITTHIHNHGWDDAGIEDAVTQLVKWEILRKKGNYLRFYPARIQITETQSEVQV